MYAYKSDCSGTVQIRSVCTSNCKRSLTSKNIRFPKVFHFSLMRSWMILVSKISGLPVVQRIASGVLLQGVDEGPIKSVTE